MNNLSGTGNWLPPVEENRTLVVATEKRTRENAEEITKEMKKIAADTVKLQEKILSLYDKVSVKELYDILIVVQHAVDISKRLN
jgi:hypothetical protein